MSRKKTKSNRNRESFWLKVNIKGQWGPECVVWCLYIALLGLFMYFHEPWYDEAQAWLIARDASWKELLFSVPHYEGHPPLWYILLAVFAKSGADFGLTVEIFTLLFNALAMYILLFRAPFPRYVRLLLPFTFFLFYQHGVICRPYSLLLLGFLLAAMFWHTKEEHPFRFAAALMLMCASSAYGIIFAGGIAIVWILENRNGRPLFPYLKTLLHGKRFGAMLTLFLFACVQIAMIMPRPDTFAASYGLGGNNPVWFRLIYALTGSIADATCYSAYEDYDELRYATFDIGKAIIGCLLGVLLLLLIYVIAKRYRKRMLFFVPFTMFALFSGLVYFYLQHIDVLMQFLLFWAWVCYKEAHLTPGAKLLPKEWKGFYRHQSPILTACTGLCLAVSLYWSFAACWNEVRYTYGFSGEIANYMETHGLTSYGVMVRWMELEDDDHNVTYINTSQTVNGVALNAYYSDNIIVNMNVLDPRLTFATHRIPSEEENQAILQKWREAGLPALTLDKCQLATVFPEYPDLYQSTYVKVFTVTEYHLWKDTYKKSDHALYAREDIARKHFLTEQKN